MAAKGLHSFIMQLPSDWELTITSLIKLLPEGRDAITTPMNELLREGYAHRILKKSGGRFDGYDYHIFDTPEHKDEWLKGSTVYGFPVNGSSEYGKAQKNIKVLSVLSIKKETGQDSTASRKKKSPSARNKTLLPVEALPFMELAKETIGFMAGSPAYNYLSTVWLDYKERGHEVALYQSLLAYRKVRTHRGLGFHSYQKLVPEIMENTDYQALWSQIVKDNPKLYPDVTEEDPTDEQIAYKQFLASLPDKSQQ